MHKPISINQTKAIHLAVGMLIFACATGAAQPSATRLPATPPAAAEKKTTDTKEEVPHIVPPLIWGEHDEWKLQFNGDTRIRFETRRNYDMDHKVGDNDKLGFARTRFNFDLTRESFLRAFFQITDSREIDAREPQRQEDYFDIHQAFVELGDPKLSPWKARLGRQEMQFGEGRLVATSSWNNLIKTYDGVRFTRKDKDTEFNAFLVQQLINDEIWHGENFSGHGHRKEHEWFYGLYWNDKRIESHEFDLYFLGLSDLDDHRTFPSDVTGENGKFGTTDRYTVGSRARGELLRQEGIGKLGYGLEGAYQFGHRADDEIRAYMLHADLNYEFEHKWKPRITLEGNLASGDRDPDDGVAGTFNALFHTAHGPYGIIDFTRLQNLRELALVGSIDPTKKLRLQIEYHNFWLDSKTDAWSSGNGSSSGRDTLGKSGRHIGQELDAFGTYRLSKWMDLEAGVAHFFSGGFASNVGRPDDANFAYVQTILRF